MSRLLVVASTFPARAGDGTPGFVRDLAQYEARHFDTLVLVPRTPGAPARERVSDSLTIEWFPYFPRRWEALAHGAMVENMRKSKGMLAQVPFFLGAELAAIRKAVRRFRPDVIHAHWVVPQGAAVLMAARGVPFVLTTLGGDLYALNGALPTRLKRAVVEKASSLTTMNTDMRERLLALGADPERTHVVPMGADLDALRKTGEGVERVPGRMLFAGRLVEKKGGAVLLEALRSLPSGWSLDVVGDGPLRADLERAAAGMPVRFLGQLSRVELAKAMYAAEVVVVPSVPAASGDQDGLPVVLLEAMGAGSAIVASRLAGIDEAVVDGESGLLVPPGDVAALRDALAGLLADPGRRAALGAAAAERAESFSVEAIGERYVALLNDALRR
ncbi:MAG TPA: glycosyltransferase [Frankiaceae bacterium]|jgi:glycosyltransferase involved in cell wall biosynthesis|nr:glycosyltransferase [Frankiaceae bacterium]